MKSMEALKCDFCDGGLVIDDSREFAVCEFCGTKYMASTLRAKIQEIRGTVTVEGAVETTTGNTEKERLIKNAETLLMLEKFDDAETTIKTITTQFPDDYRGWFFLYQLSLFRIKAGLNISYFDGKYFYKKMYYGSIPKTDDVSLASALKLCKDTNQINQFFIDLNNNYGSDIHTIHYSDANDHDYDEKYATFDIIDISGKRLNPLTIDAFTVWLLFSSNETSIIIKNQEFDSFRNRIAQMYFDSICAGQIVPYIFHEEYERWILEPLTNEKVPAFPNCLVINYLKQFSKKTPNKCNKSGYNYNIGNIVIDSYEKYFIYGKYIFMKSYCDSTLVTKTLLELPKNIDNSDIYIANNLCKHCGGAFKGLFTKTCSKCGHEKDY